MDYLFMFIDVFSFFSILFLIYNTVRSSRFKCIVDGKIIPVPTDESKNEFRRSAMAEVSRVYGGKWVEFESFEWKGSDLHIKIIKKDVGKNENR